MIINIKDVNEHYLQRCLKLAPSFRCSPSTPSKQTYWINSNMKRIWKVTVCVHKTYQDGASPSNAWYDYPKVLKAAYSIHFRSFGNTRTVSCCLRNYRQNSLIRGYRPWLLATRDLQDGTRLTRTGKNIWVRLEMGVHSSLIDGRLSCTCK